MTTEELVEDLRGWDFSQGGPWHGHDRATRCMKQAADEIEGMLRKLEDARVRIIELTRKNDRLSRRRRDEADDDTDAIAF